LATFAVILPAAGKSRRFGDVNDKKPFVLLNEKPVWTYAARQFAEREDVKQIVLVVDPSDREQVEQRFADEIAQLGIEVAEGGAERFASVENGLATIGADIDFVAVHDAARPCIAAAWIDRVFSDAEKHGAAILAIPVAGTLKKAKTGEASIEQTISRVDVWEAQTPQVFRRDWLASAFDGRGDHVVTDESQLMESAGYTVHLSMGSPINLKITTQEDLRLAQQALAAMPRGGS
jgi:2-C-methyl-D-erythritol 4-phosphate cytidylyltransferase